MLATSQRILDELNKSDEPLSAGNLAKLIKVSRQSVYNHLGILIRAGEVKEHEIKHANTTLYVPANDVNKNISVRWNGTRLSLREILTKLDGGGFPTNDAQALCAKIIVELFFKSALAIDEDDSTPIRIDELKELRSKLINAQSIVRQRLNTINDLLEEDRLWDSQKLPRDLIIKDDEIARVSDITSLIERIMAQE